MSPNLISSSYLGRSSITAKELKDLAELHWLRPDRVEVLGKEEMSPRTREGYITVFLRFFDGGLRLPCYLSSERCWTTIKWRSNS